MQMRSSCLLLVWLFILTNTASAASWTFIGRGQAFNQYFTEYVDKDDFTAKTAAYIDPIL